MTHGEIWWVDFGVPIGSLPGYRRPAIVMENDDICQSSLNTVVVIPLTTNILAGEYKPNLFLDKEITKLPKDSVAVIHLIGAVNKFSIVEKISKLSEEVYKKLVEAVLEFIKSE